MCGIIGIVTNPGARPTISAREVARLRDVMSWRGPDGSGLADLGHAVLGHRRLAVMDPTPGGDQPYRLGESVLVYNGELYNDAEVREELAREGVIVPTRCDTATVAHALATWGARGLDRLRGMYALAWLTPGTLLLARDPMGVKPLAYEVRPPTFASPGAEVRFASHGSILARASDARPRPDLEVVAWYLATIRTTMGERSLFEGVRIVPTGCWLEWDLRRLDRGPTRGRVGGRMGGRGSGGGGGTPTDEDVRALLMDSILRHARADAPVCSLLSGGLDSSIIAGTLVAHGHRPRTYSATADADAGGGAGAGADSDGDGMHGPAVARELGLAHEGITITPGAFQERWPWMIAALGVPLSTPNEVAILELSRRLAEAGHKVALSGEGADELFAGYTLPLAAIERAWAAGHGDAAEEAAFVDAAWLRPNEAGLVLRGAMREAYASAREHGRRAWLAAGEAIDEQRASAPTGDQDRGMERDLAIRQRLLREQNLEGLLGRLDSSTMLAGVEGRVPFADRCVADLAEAIPLRDRVGKAPLRRAFAGVVPARAIARAKASFPLPFQGWMAGQRGWLRQAPPWFEREALDAAHGDPASLWRWSWPMMNLARWAGDWWGQDTVKQPVTESTVLGRAG